MANRVFLHGAGQHGGIWNPLLQVGDWAPSYPGRAKVSGPPLTSISAIAGFLKPTLPENPVLIGHSMGGAVALELALQIPVAGLVLISTGARLKVRKEILEAAAAAVEPQSFGALLCQTESSRKHVERIEHEIPPATLLSDWQAVHAFDRMEEIKRINVPTLVMVGTEDPLTPPKYARYLADAIPTARLQLIPEAGHMLPFDRPELLLNALNG